MKKGKRFVKCFLTVLILVVLFVCIHGISLKEAKISVKAAGSDVSGTFSGMWSPVTGRTGTFTAAEGWTFAGHINPDGGMSDGELTNFPLSPEQREDSVFAMPEFYTGRVEGNALTDLEMKCKLE